MAFGGLNIGKTGLQANQIALDTVGRNISRANDPNYARELTQYIPVSDGNVQTRIRQAVSITLESNLLFEEAETGRLGAQDNLLSQVEALVNELSDTDLSSALEAFYGALEDLNLTPHDIATRRAVIETSQKLTDSFHRIASGYETLSDNLDREISDTSEVINGLLQDVADLNIEIVKQEGGSHEQPANELRNARREKLRELSGLIEITANEISDGSVLVRADNRTLVIHGEHYGTYVDRSEGKSTVRYSSDGAYVSKDGGGSLGGLITSRDSILAELREDLDTLAARLAWEINKAHSTGHGIEGVNEMRSETRIALNYLDDGLDIAAIDNDSLAKVYRPQNGTVTFVVENVNTGSSEEVEVKIDLIGDNKTTLETLRDDISEIDNLTASIDVQGRLTIKASNGFTFFAKEDTANLMPFLGMNNLFTGSNAANLSINEDIVNSPALFSAGQSSDPGDNTQVPKMIATRDLEVNTGTTLYQSYLDYVSDIASQKNRTSSLYENEVRIMTEIEIQRQSISGVNLDEEAADMLRFQRSYEAMAQFIAVQNDLLGVLMNLV